MDNNLNTTSSGNTTINNTNVEISSTTNTPNSNDNENENKVYSEEDLPEIVVIDYLKRCKPYMEAPADEKEDSKKIKAIFIPYREYHEAIQIYLDPQKLEKEVLDILNATSSGKRYLGKKDESHLFFQDFVRKPDKRYQSFLKNERASDFLKPKRDVIGHVILIRATMNKAGEYGLPRDFTLEQFHKVHRFLKEGYYFDFKNNLRGTTDIISTILEPDSIIYPPIGSWSFDKLPAVSLNEYFSCVGKEILQHERIEIKANGPFACQYLVRDANPPKMFSSGIFPQLKKAQMDLAHRILLWYQKKQISYLLDQPFIDDDRSYEEYEKNYDEFMANNPNLKNTQTSPPSSTPPLTTESSEYNTNSNSNNIVRNSNNDDNKDIKYITIMDKFKLPENCDIANLAEEDGKVVKFQIQAGSKEYPDFGSRVVIQMYTYLMDGTCLDSEAKSETIDIGVHGCIMGLEMALFNMRLNEKCLVMVAPEYAYGKLGAPPLVPANSTILLYIENISIHYKVLPSKQAITTYSMEERFNCIDQLRTHAKRLFESRQFGKCLKMYKSALKYLETDSLNKCSQEDWERFTECGARVCTNIAITYAVLQKPVWVRTKEYSKMAITYQEDGKAYYWLAKSQLQLGELDEALENINLATYVCTEDLLPSCHALLTKIDAALTIDEEKTSRLYQQVFQKFSCEDDEDDCK